MENMWNLKLSEEPIAEPPEGIVEEQCEYLRIATSGKVIARVSRYSGPTTDYTYTKRSLLDVMEAYSAAIAGVAKKGNKEISVDIQEDLGYIGNVPSMYFAYEFFLTSPGTPYYKYRIMFFTYTAGQYPVGIVLDNDIAQEIGEEQNIKCSSKDEFKETVKRIINSKKVSQVIETLYSIALNMEKRKNSGIATNLEIQSVSNLNV